MPSDAEAHYRLGLAYLNAGRPAEAYREFSQAAKLDPRHVGAQVELAQITAATGTRETLEAARDNLGRLLRNSQPDGDALDALAMIEFRLGKPDAAEELLGRAIASFPERVRSAVAMARLKAARGEPEQAEQTLRDLTRRAPKSAEARLALADFYVARRNWAAGASQFQEALLLDGQSDVAMIGLAMAETQMGRTSEAEKLYRQVSNLPKRQYRDVYGKYLMAERRYREAIREFERLSSANRHDRAVRNNLTIACLLGGQSERAKRILTESLAEDPKDVDALLLYSTVLLSNGEYDEAERHLQQVLSFDSNTAMAHFLLARVYRARGQALLERQELAEAIRTDPSLAPARLDLARNLLTANAAQPALDVLNAAPEQQKAATGWTILRNWALLVQGDREEFGRSAEAALRAERSPELLLQSAVSKMLARDYSGARARLAEALADEPDDERLAWAMAQCDAAEGGVAAGSRFLASYAAKRPKSAAVRMAEGQWLAKAGDYDGAREAFLAAKPLDRDISAEADFQLAMLEANKGHLDEARQSFTKLLDRQGYRLSARLWLANVEDRMHDCGAAIRDYRQVLATDGENLVALNNLAYVLAAGTDRLEEALTLAQKASGMAPGNPDVEGTLGWVLYRKGLYANAAQILEEASRKDGSAATEAAIIRRYHLGMAYLRAGERQRGSKLIATALAENPDLPEAEEARRALEDTGAR